MKRGAKTDEEDELEEEPELEDDGDDATEAGDDDDDDDEGDDEMDDGEIGAVEDPSVLYCVCRTPWDGRFMVECDGCENWFHPGCVGTTSKEVKKISSFFCPACSKKQGQDKDRKIKEREERTAKRSQAREEVGFVDETPMTPPKKKKPAKKKQPKKSGSMTPTGAGGTVMTGEGSEIRSHMIDQMTEYLGSNAAARVIAVRTEAALFSLTGGSASAKAYTARARSILYNLRDARNQQLRDRVLSGQLTPEALASAVPETLASAELIQSRRAAEQRALEKATFDDSQAPDYVREKRLQSEKILSVLADGGAPAAAGAAGGTEDPTFDAPQKKRACHEEARLVWQGTIDKSDKSNFGPFCVNGFFVWGEPDAEKLLPEILEVSGRLDIQKLHHYMVQLNSSGSRRKTVLRLEPSSDQDASQVAAIYSYFVSRQRAGFVRPKAAPGIAGVPEEIYLLPFSKSDLIPEFLRSSENADCRQALLAGPHMNRLLLILVTRVSTIEAARKPASAAVAEPSPVKQETTSAPTAVPVLAPLTSEAIKTEPQSVAPPAAAVAPVLPPIIAPAEAPAATATTSAPAAPTPIEQEKPVAAEVIPAPEATAPQATEQKETKEPVASTAPAALAEPPK